MRLYWHYIDFIVYLIVNLMRFVIILIKLLCMYVCMSTYTSTVNVRQNNVHVPYRCVRYRKKKRTYRMYGRTWERVNS